MLLREYARVNIEWLIVTVHESSLYANIVRTFGIVVMMDSFLLVNVIKTRYSTQNLCQKIWVSAHYCGWEGSTSNSVKGFFAAIVATLTPSYLAGSFTVDRFPYCSPLRTNSCFNGWWFVRLQPWHKSRKQKTSSKQATNHPANYAALQRFPAVLWKSRTHSAAVANSSRTSICSDWPISLGSSTKPSGKWYELFSSI